MAQDVEQYLQLRYPVEIVADDDGGYFARFPDLPGCMAQGETVQETLNSLESAKRAWMEVRREDGGEIPRPHELVGRYSGRFLVRIPRSLHRRLANAARCEGTSLNQYVMHLLSQAMGREAPRTPQRT